MILYCATSNAGKIKEFERQAHGRLEIRPVTGVQAPEETGTTFVENASLKAAYYSRFVDGYVFADDSGLAVDALAGAPGIYSARFAGENATDADNNAKLLASLGPGMDRTARFVCAIAVARGGEVVATFEDSVEGVVLEKPGGTNGFGYDPLFYYPPFGCTFAEVPREKKIEVSHRGKAMERMIEWLIEQERAA